MSHSFSFFSSSYRDLEWTEFFLYDLDSFEIHVLEGDVSRVETKPRSGLDVPAGDIQQFIPTLTGTSFSSSRFFDGVRDEEEGQAQARNKAESENPDEGASFRWRRWCAFVPHRLKCISYSHVTTFKIKIPFGILSQRLCKKRYELFTFTKKNDLSTWICAWRRSSTSQFNEAFSSFSS